MIVKMEKQKLKKIELPETLETVHTHTHRQFKQEGSIL